jgi:RNA polymerase sigma-70 factor (ECF subfamily)
MNAAPMAPDDGWDSVAAYEGDDGLDGLDAPGDALEAEAVAPLAASVAAACDGQLAAWIEAIVDRDERALAALYDATFTRVFGLVQRIVRNDALAEEVVEDTYFQVWRQAVRFDPARGKPMGWVLSMARSRAIDALRREARFGHDPLGDDVQAPEGPTAAPCDELLELARHHADLHEALLRLGAQPRQLVSMSYFRGLSHEEIAEQMALPLGTVKSQIRRALLALREALGERGLRLLAP